MVAGRRSLLLRNISQLIRVMKTDDDRDPGHIGSALALQQAPVGPLLNGQPADRATPAAARATALTRAGFLAAVDLCVRFLAARLGGADADAQRANEAAAQAETARIDLWRWLHAESRRLDDGTPVDFALFDDAIQRVGERLPRRGLPGQENLTRAAWLLAELTHASRLAPSAEPP